MVTTFDNHAYSHSYEVSRDGLRLIVTLFELERAVHVSLFRNGLPQPVFTVQRELCTHAHISETGFRPCFEAGAPSLPVTNMGIPPLLARGVRVYLQPHFQVELIEPRYGRT